MVGAGAGLALLASLINVLISGGLFFHALNAQIAAEGYGGSTEAALMFSLAQVVVYPILQLVLLGLALPVMFWINSERLRHPVLLVIAVLVPTLVTFLLWRNGGVLFWAMTVPGVACALVGSLAFVVLILRGLGQQPARHTETSQGSPE